MPGFDKALWLCIGRIRERFYYLATVRGGLSRENLCRKGTLSQTGRKPWVRTISTPSWMGEPALKWKSGLCFQGDLERKSMSMRGSAIWKKKNFFKSGKAFEECQLGSINCDWLSLSLGGWKNVFTWEWISQIENLSLMNFPLQDQDVMVARALWDRISF